jgi:3-hydroxymyristoyl/3-hydroxydecanoyl-(acyl carrier protein) dehydratase
MQSSKEWMKESGYNDRISFNDLQAHTVELVKDKQDEIPDGRGGIVKGMKYLVKEDGVEKTIFTGSIGLISKLAVCEPGDVVTIQMKKANNKSFYTVTKAGAEVGEATPVADDEEAPEAAQW